MLLVIGGGPAGYFSAIRAREVAPQRRVILCEKTKHPLRKVAISGGGRCNVTHDCNDPGELITRYPRGGRELRGPFHTFGPQETTAWFAEHGVNLKIEPDGRMFPTTNNARTIVDCLQRVAAEVGVEVRTEHGVSHLAHDPRQQLFTAQFADGTTTNANQVILTTGSGSGSDLAAQLGHTIIPPVPSLFTFKIDDSVLADLAGVTVAAAQITIPGAKKLRETGPLLVTHWGLSGPTVLRLSAWGARYFHDHDYRGTVVVNWCPELSASQIDAGLVHETRAHGRQLVVGGNPYDLPKRLWRALAAAAGIDQQRRWADLSKTSRQALTARLSACTFQMAGQAVNKEEFVTCGGVKLKELDFRTMGSRVVPGLFLAGEVLDIDGITGGYNFQACWTGGWLAGSNPPADR